MHKLINCFPTYVPTLIVTTFMCGPIGRRNVQEGGKYILQGGKYQLHMLLSSISWRRFRKLNSRLRGKAYVISGILISGVVQSTKSDGPLFGKVPFLQSVASSRRTSSVQLGATRDSDQGAAHIGQPVYRLALPRPSHNEQERLARGLGQLARATD
jgi:hypothetical protein